MAKVTSMNEQQIQAVEARNSHILVSAPAGSGKTKILVSRILSILKEGVNIDSFLVLTFTQAAAKEMKQRLSHLLEEEIAIASGDLKDHLMKQKERMPLASITNFHGFCNSLIQHYGYLVGVQPGYEILSDNKPVLKEALTQAIDKLLEDEEFSAMRALYFSRRDELEEQVMRLYEILQAVGNKEEFIRYMNEDVYGFLENPQGQDLSQWCFYPQLMDQLAHVVLLVLVEIEELKYFCMENGIEAFYQRPDGQKGLGAKKPVPYDALVDYYTELLSRLTKDTPFLKEGGVNEWAIQKPASSYNIPWKDYGEDIEEIKAQFNRKKTAINGKFSKIYEKLVDSDNESTSLIHQESKRVIGQLLKAVEKTEWYYRQLKEKQAVLDFNDLEKYATRLLQKDLWVAKTLNEKLYEIMIDEYQDTNMVQETIVSLISKATTKEVPCFMVGDMKQSIYRFRQADPEIFKEKFDTYPTKQGAMRIDLGFNYRSSKVVLDSINYIFNQIMDPHIGSLDYYYDTSAQLNYDFLRKEGAKDTSEYDEVKEGALQKLRALKDDTTEVLMVNTSSHKPKEIEDEEYEAWMVGQRILELKENGMDGKELSYSDIAVLMRQTTRFMTYKKVFDKLDIPTTIVLSNGFMDATEIRQMVNVLLCLNNPYDDLALMSVLKAPFKFSSFKEKDIANIRDHTYSLYENICSCDQFQNFISVLEELKVLQKQLSFSRWFDVFYEVSGYLKCVAGFKNGTQRYQNLLLLREKVREVENHIYDFQTLITHLEQLKESNPAPSTMPKDQDAVVFMTIHKSKGLEFPVTFVAMHSKKFNLQDSKERLIFDRHLTMAIKPRQAKQFEKELFNDTITYQDVVVEFENPFLALLSKLTYKEAISEEMRVYYVALTRAKNKLILTGCLSEEEMQEYVTSMEVNDLGNVPEKDEWIFNRKMRDASCYLDWLMPSVLSHPDIPKKGNYHYVKPALENTANAKFSFSWKDYDMIQTEAKQPSTSGQAKSQTSLFREQDYSYERHQKQSVSVTSMEKETIVVAQNVKKVESSQLSATDKGTLVHEFMEYLPLDGHVSIKNIIEMLYNEKRYSDIEYQVLCEYVEKLETFVASQAFCMMQEAKTCLREQPISFMKEGQLIHGTLDVLCLFDDKICVIDYKTDRVSPYAKNEDLILRHATQLNLYKEALKMIEPSKTIEGYLYYLEIGRFVKV